MNCDSFKATTVPGTSGRPCENEAVIEVKVRDLEKGRWSEERRRAYCPNHAPAALLNLVHEVRP